MLSPAPDRHHCPRSIGPRSGAERASAALKIEDGAGYKAQSQILFYYQCKLAPRAEVPRANNCKSLEWLTGITARIEAKGLSALVANRGGVAA